MTTTTLSKNRLWSNQRSVMLLTIIVANILLALSAQISIPLQPVPITLQVFAVLALSLSLGWRLSFAAYLAYMLEGCLGLPVFANGGFGLATLLGPHGGYLWGFGAAILACGYFAERGAGRYFLSSLAVGILGVVLIYACGLAWLSYLIGSHAAWQAGILPFIAVDALKVIIIALIAPRCWRA